MSLVARHLEANGIPTVIVGAARDVVEQCGVPRFVFTDFPLGNPCGKPYDAEMQRAIIGHAFELLESARAPRTTMQTAFTWDESGSWRTQYMRVDAANRAELRREGDERRARRGRRVVEGRVRTG